MGIKSLLVIFSTIPLLIACESSSMTKGSTTSSVERETVETKVNDFFEALRRGDRKELQAIYPGFQKLENNLGSDTATIKSITEEGSVYVVSVHHVWRNSSGNQQVKDVQVFIRPTTAGKLDLFDSKGMAAFEKAEYLFGIKTGCINSARDTSDQQVARAMEKVRLLLPEKALAIYVELKKGIQVTGWNWVQGDDSAVFGEGVVHNNSLYAVPDVKYKISYYNKKGNTIATDTGHVTYAAIKPGDSTGFTFYTNNAGRPSKAEIELLFDDELVFTYLQKKNWTGKECEEYFRKHP
jgi:hypothetical protein